ncbi:MAG: T9SS type A sorting domain-containing protein [Ignavibacteriales bacterium]|nr:T9SS type A sorting domain-containing protein [Ignavibacteriales bacterium]
MLKPLMIFCFLASKLYTFAQVPDTLWTKTFDGAGQDAGYSVQQTSDGGYIAVGFTTQLTGEDVFLIKTDSLGELIWNKSFDKSGSGISRDVGLCVQQTNDDGYIITGSTMMNWPNQDIWLIKTDSGGNIEWDKVFGGDSTDYGSYVLETPDSGYLLIGTTYSYGAGGSDVWLIKTDKNGNTVWTKFLGESDHYETGKCLQPTNEGGYIIAGETRTTYYPQQNVKALLIKINSSGDPEWSSPRTFGHSDSTYTIKACKQTLDGGYVLCGQARAWGSNDRAVLVIKTDQVGNLIWLDKYYSGENAEGGNSLDVTFNSEIIIVGGGGPNPPAASQSVLIFKLDLNGIIRWSIILFSDGSPAWNGSLYSVKQNLDGSYISVGSFRSEPLFNQNIWLLKIASDIVSTSLTANASAGSQILEVANTSGFSAGDNIMINPGGLTEEINQVTGFGSLQLATPLLYNHQAGELVLNLNPTSIDEESEILQDYKLYNNYPNPFNPTTTIKYQIPEISFVTIKVYDILGREVATLVNEEKTIGTYEIIFSANALASGIYFYRLQSGNTIQIKKMLLLK